MRLLLPIFPGIPLCQAIGTIFPFWPAIILSGIVMCILGGIFIAALYPLISGHRRRRLRYDPGSSSGDQTNYAIVHNGTFIRVKARK